MSFKIEFSQRSQRDLEEIFVYIRNDSPENAKHWRLKLAEKLSSLTTQPEACGFAIDMHIAVAKCGNFCSVATEFYSRFASKPFIFSPSATVRGKKFRETNWNRLIDRALHPHFGFFVLDRFPLLHRVKHFAGLRAVVFTDDAVFGHVVDETSRAAVTDTERSLQQ